MAIQIPNAGTGNGATGDNEFVLWTKVINNFNDSSNAASRLVGEGINNVMQVGAFGLGGNAAQPESVGALTHTAYSTSGFYRHGSNSTQCPTYNQSGDTSMTTAWASTFFGQIHLSSSNNGRMSFRYVKSDQAHSWREVYHTANTTLDGNGALKPSSPVLRVFSDRIEGNDDGDAMTATYTKNGIGDYTITGTTGLRTDGWYVVIPNDMNGNPKVAITLDDTDGVITLKTYVRIFDMGTFKFVPDLEQPLDISDGRWIDLRFNDLPIEDEPLLDEV